MKLFLLLEFHVAVTQTPRRQKATKNERSRKKEKKKRREQKGIQKKGQKRQSSRRGDREDRKLGDEDDDRSDSGSDNIEDEGNRRYSDDDSDVEGGRDRSRGRFGADTVASSKERLVHMCCGWSKIPLSQEKVKNVPAEHIIYCGNPWMGNEASVLLHFSTFLTCHSNTLALIKSFPSKIVQLCW